MVERTSFRTIFGLYRELDCRSYVRQKARFIVYLHLFQNVADALHLHVLKFPHSDYAVGVTGEQREAVGTPAEAGTLWWRLVSVSVTDLYLEFFYQLFLLQVPDLDAATGGSAQPVPVGAEDELADLLAAFQAVKWVLGGITQVPELGAAVLSTAGSQRSIWRHGDAVDETAVSSELGFKVEVGQVPYLDGVVPTARNDHRVLRGWAELHRAHPFVVTVFALLAPFQLTERIPQLDGLVATRRDDLSVVGGEGDTQYVVLVSDESGGGDASLDVPEAERLVPRGGDSELTARGNDNVGDEVVVALESADWEAVGAGVLGQAPDDEGLVTRRGNEHFWVLWVGGDLGDPVTVALEGASQVHNFLCHFRRCFGLVDIL